METKPTSAEVAVLVVAILGIGGIQTAHAQEDEGLGPRVIAVVPESAVPGLPLPVTFDVRGPMETFHSYPWDGTNPFEVAFVDEEQRLVVPKNDVIGERIVHMREGVMTGPRGETMPVPIEEREGITARPLHLAPEQTATLVADMSAVSPGDRPRELRPIELHDPPHGHFTVEMQADEAQVTLVRPRVEFIRRNASEQALLEAMADPERQSPPPTVPIGETLTSWDRFVLTYPRLREQVDLAGLSQLGRRQLAYYLLLAELVHDERPIAELEVPEQAIEQALPAWGLSISLLQFEIAAARDDAQAVAALRRQILEAAPQWEEILDHTEEAGGRIRHYREMLPEAKHAQDQGD
ncbi:MAG: hypothetical protein WD534_11955 [Phycisphaeraceae bacterium]